MRASEALRDTRRRLENLIAAREGAAGTSSGGGSGTDELFDAGEPLRLQRRPTMASRA
jgi:hypothetical protein